MTGIKNYLYFIFLLCMSINLTGCLATKKDMIALQEEIAKLNSSILNIKGQLENVEKQFFTKQAGLAAEISSVQRNQADLSVGMEELNWNIRSLNLRVDATNEKFQVFGRKLDDNSADFTNKLSIFSEKFTRKMEEMKPTPTQLYGAAYTDYTTKNYDLAIEGFKEYLAEYSTGMLAPNAQYWMSICYYEKGDMKSALEQLDEFMQKFPESPLMKSVMFKKAGILVETGEKELALPIYENIVKDYPETPEASQASEFLPKPEPVTEPEPKKISPQTQPKQPKRQAPQK